MRRKIAVLLGVLALAAMAAGEPQARSCGAAQAVAGICIPSRKAPAPQRRPGIDPDARRRFLRKHGRQHFITPHDPFLRWIQEEQRNL